MDGPAFGRRPRSLEPTDAEGAGAPPVLRDAPEQRGDMQPPRVGPGCFCAGRALRARPRGRLPRTLPADVAARTGRPPVTRRRPIEDIAARSPGGPAPDSVRCAPGLPPRLRTRTSAFVFLAPYELASARASLWRPNGYNFVARPLHPGDGNRSTFDLGQTSGPRRAIRHSCRCSP